MNKNPVPSWAHRCGTPALSIIKLTMLKNPSPRMNPDASTINGVSSLVPFFLHHQATSPPTVLARVKLGTTSC